MSGGVSIIIVNKKVYIPSHAKQHEFGGFTIVAPVFEVDIENEEITNAIINVTKQEIKTISEIPNEDVILKATKVRSWKKLVKIGYSYAISWTEKKKRLDVQKENKYGQWQFDRYQAKEYPVDTPFEVIVKDMIDDLKEKMKKDEES